MAERSAFMDAMSLGANIERARRRAGLTQVEVESVIGKKSGTISGYENGHFRPDLDLLVPLADAMHASLDELLRDGPMAPSPNVLTPDELNVLAAFRSFRRDGLTAERAISALGSAAFSGVRAATPAGAEDGIVPPLEPSPRPGTSAPARHKRA